jgi:hypothetical protein
MKPRSRTRATEAEHDLGYGASHGYGPGHGGPSGPGDAPGDAEPRPPSAASHASTPSGEDDSARPSEAGPGEAGPGEHARH